MPPMLPLSVPLSLSLCPGLLHAPHATPECAPARKSLSALLTPSLAERLREADPRPLLLQLNEDLETPQVRYCCCYYCCYCWCCC